MSDGEGGYIDVSADFSQGDDFTHSVAVGDINGDGLFDIVFLQTRDDPNYYEGSTLQFLIQQPDGSFSDDTDSYWDSSLHGSWSGWESGVTFADLDEDGDLDMLIQATFPDAHRIFLQDEDGQFQFSQNNFGSSNETLALIDMDFDGVEEIAVIGLFGVTIYDNNVTPYNDIYEGDEGGNLFLGSAADETFYGYEFRDYMEAGDGDDTMHGGRGRDRSMARPATTPSTAMRTATGSAAAAAAITSCAAGSARTSCSAAPETTPCWAARTSTACGAASTTTCCVAATATTTCAAARATTTCGATPATTR